jgi:DHA2 family multidrug resistance protein
MYKQKKILTLCFICLATSLFTIDMGIITISFSEIENYFSTTNSVTSWVLTVFSISSAIGIISLGFMSKLFGRKRIYLLGILGFSFFSGLCGLSNNIEQLLICRFFQGFFGSSLIALSQAFVIDIFSQKNRSKAISAWTFGLLSGPVIGPLLGGYLIEFMSWRYIFFINLPLGLIAFFGLIYYLNNDKSYKYYSIDILSFIFLSISIACFQIFLDRGELEGWFESKFIVFLIILSMASFIFFLLKNFSSKISLFSPLLFKDNFFIGGIIFAFLFGFILIPPFILIPIYLTEIQSFPIYYVGIILSISGLGGMIATVFTSKVISYIGNVKTMLLGLFIYITANLEIIFWNSNISTNQIILNSLYRGVSISTYYVALANITYTTLPNNLRTEGASLFQFLRTIGTGVSIAFFVTLLNRYYIINFEDLRNYLNFSNTGVSQYTNIDKFFNEDKLIILRELQYHSKIKSFLNDFFILSVSPLLFLPFFLFFKKKS